MPSYSTGATDGGSISPSICVEVRDIPWLTTDQDIKKFFSPIPVFDPSIKFKNDKFGRNRSVLVKFVNADQKDQALQKSGYTICGQRVQVVEIPMSVWETTEKSVSVIPPPQEPYVKMSFIPKRATREDIAAIFKHTPDQLIVSKEKNRESLVAYVKCANLDDIQTLLNNKVNALICESRVKVEPIQEADFEAGQKDVVDPYTEQPQQEESSYSIEYPPKRPHTGPLNDRYHYNRNQAREAAPPKPPSPTIKSNCCLLKNLPPAVTDREIVDFFDDVDILPTQIHIMFNADYQQTGESYCEFRSEADAETALQKNNTPLRDRPVSVGLIPQNEVTAAIGVPKLLPMIPHSDTVTESADGSQVPVNEECEQTEDATKEMTEETVEDSSDTAETGQQSALPSLLAPMKRPPPYKMKPQYPEAGYPEFRGRHAPYPPRHPHMRKPFGAPGCVVMLENVPYRAEVDEILEFFGEFELTQEQVTRRFTEWGQATGDVRVWLRTPYEAQRAVRTLNGCMMRNRTITASIVP